MENYTAINEYMPIGTASTPLVSPRLVSKEPKDPPDSVADTAVPTIASPNRVREASQEDEVAKATEVVPEATEKVEDALQRLAEPAGLATAAEVAPEVHKEEAKANDEHHQAESVTQETCTKPTAKLCFWKRVWKMCFWKVLFFAATTSIVTLFQAMIQEADVVPSGFALDVEACAGQVEGVTIISGEGLAHLLCKGHEEDVSVWGLPRNKAEEALCSKWWMVGAAFPLAVTLKWLL